MRCSGAPMAYRLMLVFALSLAAAACGKPADTASAPAAPTAPTATAATNAVNPTPSAAGPTRPPSIPPPPLDHPLDVGSQAAKDDLYCSGMLFSKYAASNDVLSPTDEAARMRGEQMAMAIAQAGADKLMAEGAARVTQIG